MSAALHTKLCDILGIRHPIIQTAMGWIATPELVAASCNAGALGLLATANLRPDEVDAQIQQTKKLTDAPFGVNFLMEAPGADEIVEAIVRHRVKVASYSRSPNPEFIKRFKEAGILCIPTCGAARHAQKAVQLGADIVIVQGGEGGGHTGTVPTSILASQVVDLIDAPVVAAGGFKDGRGLVAALAFGAAGIAMGTRAGSSTGVERLGAPAVPRSAQRSRLPQALRGLDPRAAPVGARDAAQRESDALADPDGGERSHPGQEGHGRRRPGRRRAAEWDGLGRDRRSAQLRRAHRANHCRGRADARVPRGSRMTKCR
jgi:hypothetical protein